MAGYFTSPVTKKHKLLHRNNGDGTLPSLSEKSKRGLRDDVTGAMWFDYPPITPGKTLDLCVASHVRIQQAHQLRNNSLRRKYYCYFRDLQLPTSDTIAAHNATAPSRMCSRESGLSKSPGEGFWSVRYGISTTTATWMFVANDKRFQISVT